MDGAIELFVSTTPLVEDTWNEQHKKNLVPWGPIFVHFAHMVANIAFSSMMDSVLMSHILISHDSIHKCNMKTKDGTVKLNTQSIYSTHPITRRDILSLIEGPGAPKKYMLMGKTVIGRSPEANIQIRSNMVSRKHIQLSKDDFEMTCTDLHSHNGFFLNGIRVHSATLRDGDTIQIGDVIFLYNQGVQWTSM